MLGRWGYQLLLDTANSKGQQHCHLDKHLMLSQPVSAVRAAKVENTDTSLNFRIPNSQKLGRNQVNE